MNGINWQVFRSAYNHIIRNLQMWDQTAWHSDCGTTHCFAGWVELEAAAEKFDIAIPLPDLTLCDQRSIGVSAQSGQTREVARARLNITYDQASWLFSFDRTLVDFERCIQLGNVPTPRTIDPLFYDWDALIQSCSDEGLYWEAWWRTLGSSLSPRPVRPNLASYC